MGRNKFSMRKDDWKKIEENNATIALNVLVLYAKKEIMFMLQSISQIVENKLLF